MTRSYYKVAACRCGQVFFAKGVYNSEGYLYVDSKEMEQVNNHGRFSKNCFWRFVEDVTIVEEVRQRNRKPVQKIK